MCYNGAGVRGGPRHRGRRRRRGPLLLRLQEDIPPQVPQSSRKLVRAMRAQLRLCESRSRNSRNLPFHNNVECDVCVVFVGPTVDLRLYMSLKVAVLMVFWDCL